MKEKVASVRTLLESMKPQLALALPKHLNPDRLARIVLTSCLRNPKLLDCTKESFAGAVLQAAQLGLEPDGVLGMAYLIPYTNRKKNCLEVQFQAGYKGLLDLGRRSGDIGAVNARVVYKNDRFAYRFGLTPLLEHTPAPSDRGDATYVYAVVGLKDGSTQWDVMSVEDIEKHRKQYSKAASDGPWVTAWEEMAKKTVLRRVLKYAPASVELQRAIALDEHAEAEIPQDLSAVLDFSDPAHDSKKPALDQLADDLSLTPEQADLAREEG